MAAAVKETVQEALLGSSVEPGMSEQSKANFMKYAKLDEKSGEYFLGEDEFINLVAPENEDYVRVTRSVVGSGSVLTLL